MMLFNTISQIRDYEAAQKRPLRVFDLRYLSNSRIEELTGFVNKKHLIVSKQVDIDIRIDEIDNKLASCLISDQVKLASLKLALKAEIEDKEITKDVFKKFVKYHRG